MALINCEACGGKVSDAAASWPHCGHPLRAATPATPVHVVAGPSPGLAAVLSFLLPGLGHLYLGQPFQGLLWFGMTLLGYALLIIPGVIFHLLAIWQSYKEAEKKGRNS